MKLGAVLIGVLLTVLAVAGCGGGDGSDASTTTKAEFVRQAEEICAKTAKKQEAAAIALIEEQQERGQRTAREVQEGIEEVLTEVVVPGLGRMASELDALEKPDGEADRVNAVVEAYEAAVKEIQADPEPVADAEVDPVEEPRKLAAAYGMKACAQV